VRFLKLIGTAVPDGLELHLICDNYATRKTPAIKKWPLPRFHLHFPPTSSSRINLVERGFAELTNRKLRRSAHRSVTDWKPTSASGSTPGTKTQAIRLDQDRRRDPRHPRRLLPANSSNSGQF
jgi:transposase